MNKEDLNGKKFNRLTVIGFSHSKNGTFWYCKCDCGNEMKANGAMLKNNHTKSCGCLQKEINKERLTKHSLCGTPTYKTWDSMIQRCTNEKHKNYKIYGGRNIRVCEKWFDFKTFIEDMGLRPPDLTLDRIDSNKGYYKENCRWITTKRQANNTRKNVNVTCNGKTLTISQWSEELGISRSTLNNRLFRSKWSVEKSFNTKIGGN